MAFQIKTVYSLLLFFLFSGTANGQNTAASVASGGTISIVFENILTDKGSIKLALYKSAETFLDPEKAVAFYSFEVQEKGKLTASIDRITYGEYAIAVFHDENNNGALETNFFGIPSEPYCFSGNGHSKWKPPVFADAKFLVSEKETKLSLRLERWKL